MAEFFSQKDNELNHAADAFYKALDLRKEYFKDYTFYQNVGFYNNYNKKYYFADFVVYKKNCGFIAIKCYNDAPVNEHLEEIKDTAYKLLDSFKKASDNRELSFAVRYAAVYSIQKIENSETPFGMEKDYTLLDSENLKIIDQVIDRIFNRDYKEFENYISELSDSKKPEDIVDPEQLEKARIAFIKLIENFAKAVIFAPNESDKLANDLTLHYGKKVLDVGEIIPSDDEAKEFLENAGDSFYILCGENADIIRQKFKVENEAFEYNTNYLKPLQPLKEEVKKIDDLSVFDEENFDSESEKEFYKILKNKLDDNYVVFPSITWSKTDGKNSNCDFLILDKRRGFLCLEVKGGKSLYWGKDKDKGQLFFIRKKGNKEEKIFPYSQALKNLQYFQEKYKQETGKEFPGYSAVAFVHHNIIKGQPTSIWQTRDSKVTIFKTDCEGDLKKRFDEIFDYYESLKTTFDINDYDGEKLIEFINRRTAICYAKGAMIQYSGRDLEKVEAFEDVIVDALKNYKTGFIKGGAGTGKTYIGIKMLQKAASEGKKGIYLCHNIMNRNKASELLEDTDIEVEGLINNKFFQYNKYDLIIVDEAQDCSSETIETISNHIINWLKTQSRIFLFSDNNQRIFSNEKADITAEDFGLKNIFQLSYNLRNTQLIHNRIKELTGYDKDMFGNDVVGVKPQMPEKICESEEQAVQKIKQYIDDLSRDEVYSGITIVSNCNIEKLPFVKEMLSEAKYKHISYYDIRSFKGCESNVVICIDRDLEKNYGKQKAALVFNRLYYTALTRAKYLLYVVTIKNDS
jgi:hypothetical protein